MSYLDTSDLTRKPPEKRLTHGLRKKGGRNNHGRTTVRYRGGGHKRLYRIIDWKRSDKDGIPAKVVALEYDPNRNARLHLLQYADGETRYVLAAHKVEIGQVVMNGPKAEPKPGNSMVLKDIPTGLHVHAVEMIPGRGAQLARGAGGTSLEQGLSVQPLLHNRPLRIDQDPVADGDTQLRSMTTQSNGGLPAFICNIDATAMHVQDARRQEVLTRLELSLEERPPTEAI